jgi:hypothetical protein
MRVSDEFIEKLDEWCNRQPDRPSRSEALRRLVETHPLMQQALATKGVGKK